MLRTVKRGWEVFCECPGFVCPKKVSLQLYLEFVITHKLSVYKYVSRIYLTKNICDGKEGSGAAEMAKPKVT